MIRASQSSRRGLRSDEQFRTGAVTPSRLRRSRRFRLAPTLALAAVLLAAPWTAQAQRTPRYPPRDTGWAPPASPPRTGARPSDFLLDRPKASLSLRAGMLFPRAHSQIFLDQMQELTLSHSDFYAPMIGLNASFWMSPRTDFMFDLAYSRSSKRSDYRGYADNNNDPIQQWTRLAQLPATLGIRAYLLPRGRQVGHFAWIPTAYSPYIGILGGGVYHKFRQSGDFIDLNNPNLPIFTDTYTSSGWSPMLQLMAGSDISINRHAALQLEARYGWSSADMGADFRNFDNIDLAGLQTTIGISWRLSGR